MAHALKGSTYPYEFSITHVKVNYDQMTIFLYISNTLGLWFLDPTWINQA